MSPRRIAGDEYSPVHRDEIKRRPIVVLERAPYCIITIESNAAESGMRGPVLGRKNYLFCGSDAGGKRAACIYTIIETCRMNSVDPQAYLADVLARVADHPIHRIDELLPGAGQSSPSPGPAPHQRPRSYADAYVQSSRLTQRDLSPRTAASRGIGSIGVGRCAKRMRGSLLMAVSGSVMLHAEFTGVASFPTLWLRSATVGIAGTVLDRTSLPLPQDAAANWLAAARFSGCPPRPELTARPCSSISTLTGIAFAYDNAILSRKVSYPEGP